MYPDKGVETRRKIASNMIQWMYIVLLYITQCKAYSTSRLLFRRPFNSALHHIDDLRGGFISFAGSSSFRLLLQPHRGNFYESFVKTEKASTKVYNMTNTRSFYRKLIASLFFPLLLTSIDIRSSYAEDELAKYAAEGNTVGVDGQCFMSKCALETASCVNNRNCVKGLSCLARCKGGSMCSTGCFAKFGSDKLDNLLSCTIEKNDCVKVPKPKDVTVGWTIDKQEDLPSTPIFGFDPKLLNGKWYKIMGLDSKYDCFDCQKNTFSLQGREDYLIKRFKALEEQKNIQVGMSDVLHKTNSISGGNPPALFMEALFRIPRQTYPGYLQSRIKEELKVVENIGNKNDGTVSPNFQSEGQMFGLTFWENWYVLGDTFTMPSAQSMDSLVAPTNAKPFRVFSVIGRSPVPDMKLIYYTGHTLQGNYKGAFVYSRTANLTPDILSTARDLISNAGLNPNEFCIVRNQCFATEMIDERFKYKGALSKQFDDKDIQRQNQETNEDAPNWFIGERFFQLSRKIAAELADWFEDPSLLSDWLVEQQQRVVFDNPFAVSPFADLSQAGKETIFEQSRDLQEIVPLPKENLAKDVISINQRAYKKFFSTKPSEYKIEDRVYKEN